MESLELYREARACNGSTRARPALRPVHGRIGDHVVKDQGSDLKNAGATTPLDLCCDRGRLRKARARQSMGPAWPHNPVLNRLVQEQLRGPSVVYDDEVGLFVLPLP